MTNTRILFWCNVLGGILVVAFYCTFTFTSLVMFPPPYSAMTNWLSDLGNSTYSPQGAIWYNLGCILTGAALFPFFIGLQVWKVEGTGKKAVLSVVQATGMFSGLALVMIGIFSEDFPPQHITWSGIYFLVNMIVQLVASIAMLFHPRSIKWIAVYGFVTSGINTIFVIIFSDSPLIEWTTVFTALGFAGLIVVNTALRFKK